METAYYLRPDQLPSVDAFERLYGLDAMVGMIAEFEKHGSLGEAMITVAHKLQEVKIET